MIEKGRGRGSKLPVGESESHESRVLFRNRIFRIVREESQQTSYPFGLRSVSPYF